MREHKTRFEDESKVEQYQRGYLHDIDDVERNIDLINRHVIVNNVGSNQNQPSSIQHNTKKKRINNHLDIL